MDTTTLTRAGLGLGLVIITITAGCGGSSARARREDALWREVRAHDRRRAPADDAALFAGAERLDRARLIEEVLVRNPDVDAAREGLRAALAEVEQAGALADPTVSYELAPLSVGTHTVGQRVELRQMVMWPGKRGLAAEAALAEAEAVGAEVDAVRLELAQMASAMFDDLYMVGRALAINAHHRGLLEEMREVAEAQYVVGKAAAQDPIMAEVELAELDLERLALESERDQVIAQLNGLLHRPTRAALPPPPEQLDLAGAPDGTAEELQALALERRPQRAASAARIRAGRAEIAMAERDFYPDLELMTSYDTMWEHPEHRWMVGVMIEVPLQRGRRHAAVEEAEAMTARMERMDDVLVDQIRVEVERAHRAVAETAEIVSLREDKLLPAVRARVDAAYAGFLAAEHGFDTLVMAEKELRHAELELEMARVELSRRRAALARVVGGAP